MLSEFETIGNASLAFHVSGRPVLMTDPWLTGTCYFGSWGLDRPLTADELQTAQTAEYIWFSHGHPDHLHPESLALLSRDQKILVPDHYLPDIANGLRAEGFTVEVMQYRQWRQLAPGLRCMCIDNENQDGILIVEAGDSLVIKLNDSPLCGERRFIRGLVKHYDRKKTYLAKLCAFDADMINIVETATGERVIGPAEERKPGTVWSTARVADSLGVGSFVSSSSQHIYLRIDSIWANPYRVTWADIQRFWPRPHIRIIEPFVRVDLATGHYHRKHPDQTSDWSQITDGTGTDDADERMTEADWSQVTAFFRKFKIIPFDHIDVVVAGERRRVRLDPASENKPEADAKGFGFRLPRKSLMDTVQSGFFGDLLIGNFMRTELHNATLWPGFTPVVAMLASNANVYTMPDLRRFRRRYFRRNPAGYIEWAAEKRSGDVLNVLREVSGTLGIKPPLKRLYRWMIGDPVASP